MATPTPLKQPPHPYPQAMTPGSLANHLGGGGAGAFSPAPPRSVGQSPAQQHLSKKSPATHAALGLQRHQSSTSGGGAVSMPLAYDSPTAAALGLNLNLNLSLPLPGLDVIGVTTGGVTNVRADEEERRRRVETIVSILKARPGRISEEGVERLAKTTGLECLWQDGPDGARTLSIAGSGVLIDVDFKSDIVTRVALSFPTSSESVSSIAGRAARILQRDLTIQRGKKSSSSALLSVNTGLAAFAAHLERLARLDKLSLPQLNCYDAIWGVYASLHRVFEWEKQRVRDLRMMMVMMMMMDEEDEQDDDEEAIERQVMCKYSGRPRMHAAGRVGLSLEYWMQRRLVRRGRKRKSPDDNDDDDEKMDDGDDDDDQEEDRPKTWAAVIECEPSPAELFPSVRLSRDWVSARVGVVKTDGQAPAPPPHDDLFGDDDDDAAAAAAATAAPEAAEDLTPPLLIDWLEPLPTYVSTSSSDDGLLPKLPDIRFVAILTPPVVVPLHAAYEIAALVGSSQILQTSSSMTSAAATYDDLLLDRLGLGRHQLTKPSSSSSLSGEAEPEPEASMRKARIERDTLVLVDNDDDDATTTTTTTAAKEEKEEVRHHRFDVWVPKQDYGRVLEEIPFSHPRQIVAILPILRQYAFLSSLIPTPTPSSSLSSRAPPPPAPHSPSSPTPSQSSSSYSSSSSSPSSPLTPTDLTSFLSPASPSSSSHPNHPQQIDISISTSSTSTSTSLPSPPPPPPPQPSAAGGGTGLPSSSSSSSSPSSMTPKISLIFPSPSHHHLTADELKTITATFLILPSADLRLLLDGNDDDDDDGEKNGPRVGRQDDNRRPRMIATAEKAMGIAEDVGVWVEWWRRRQRRRSGKQRRG